MAEVMSPPKPLTKEQARAAEIAAFVMPKVKIGDPILWNSDGKSGQGQFPATVAACGGRTITLCCNGVKNRGVLVIDGVRHQDDPGLGEWDVKDKGSWEKSSFLLRIERIEAVVLSETLNGINDIKPRLNALEDFVSKEKSSKANFGKKNDPPKE